jgi:TM2 domain-containing membrane protein YozV
MTPVHKNKTFATLLAFALGGIGLHRFYLHGWKDPWAWVHLASVPACLAVMLATGGRAGEFTILPWVLSALAGFIEALVIGLTPDDKWDALHNPDSARSTASGWPVALLLVLTLGVGATGLIATIARSFDLLYTGGAYG